MNQYSILDKSTREKLVVLATCFLISLSGSAQYNFDFETWNSVQSFENPAGWRTNSLNNYVCVRKSTDSNSGDFSAQVESNRASLEGKGPGVLWTTIDSLDNPILEIQFFTKVDSLFNGGEVNVIASGHLNGNICFSDTLRITTVSTTWSTNSLHISDTLQTPDSVVISFIANVVLSSTGYVGYSKFKVDDVSLIYNDIGVQKHSIDIKILPLPATNRLSIQTEQIKVHYIEILDCFGRIIYSNSMTNEWIDISTIPNGSYFIVLNTTNGTVIKNLLINR